jgi:hypothetical protein
MGCIASLCEPADEWTIMDDARCNCNPQIRKGIFGLHHMCLRASGLRATGLTSEALGSCTRRATARSGPKGPCQLSAIIVAFCGVDVEVCMRVRVNHLRRFFVIKDGLLIRYHDATRLRVKGIIKLFNASVKIPGNHHSGGTKWYFQVQLCKQIAFAKPAAGVWWCATHLLCGFVVLVSRLRTRTTESETSTQPTSDGGTSGFSRCKRRSSEYKTSGTGRATC